jgi:hypothetical protein
MLLKAVAAYLFAVAYVTVNKNGLRDCANKVS